MLAVIFEVLLGSGILIGGLKLVLSHNRKDRKGLVDELRNAPNLDDEKRRRIVNALKGICFGRTMSVFARELRDALSCAAPDFAESLTAYENAFYVIGFQALKCEVRRILRDTRIDDPVPVLIGMYSSTVRSEPYHTEVIGRLTSLINARVASWMVDYGQSHQNQRDWRVLVLGQARRSLIEGVLDSLYTAGKAFGEKKIYVDFKGCREEIVPELKKKMSRSLDMELARVADSPRGDNFYDVILSAHYWQHLSSSEWRKLASGGDLDFELRENGLLIWMSAVSRHPEIDEFVCEGEMPQKLMPNGTDRAARIKYEGVYSTRTKLVSYKPIRGVEKFFSDAGFGGFPVTVEGCFTSEEERTMILGDFLFSLLNEGMVGVAIRDDVKYVGCVRSNKEVRGIEVYRIYSVRMKNGCDLQFIVSEGHELSFVRTGCGVKTKRFTYFPAWSMRTAAASLNYETVRWLPVNGAFAENGLASRRETDFVDETLDDGKTGSVCRLLTPLENVADQRFLFVRPPQDSDSLICYSLLPIRKFLADEGDMDEHAFNNEGMFKKLVAIAGPLGLVPVRNTSVTALRSYHNIGAMLEARGMEVTEKDFIFFHQIFHSIVDAALNKAVLSDHRKDCECWAKQPQTVDCDIGFNKLSLDERLGLLACMNVHNVMITAVKCGLPSVITSS